jgi:ketosteroid isomerase-like protein
MKSLIISVFLFVTMLGVAATKAEQEVANAMDAYRQAMVKRDAATLDRLFHKDLTYSHSNAKTESKSEAIEAATKGPSVTEAIEVLEQTTRIYGKTALVKAKMDFRSNNAGNVQTAHLSVLHVWMKFPAGWQLVGRQSTRIPQ